MMNRTRQKWSTAELPTLIRPEFQSVDFWQMDHLDVFLYKSNIPNGSLKEMIKLGLDRATSPAWLTGKVDASFLLMVSERPGSQPSFGVIGHVISSACIFLVQRSLCTVATWV